MACLRMGRAMKTSALPFTWMPSRKRQSGAFDLPSVLIGVAVVAILAIGVMATIFGVIPWSQDRAAKQDLAAMNTAQGTAYARDGNFVDKASLVGAGWLGEGTPESLDAKADVEGKCYVAITTSKTGNKFIISHDKPTPRPLTASDAWCSGVQILQDTAPVMISTWSTSAAANCKQITLPVQGLKGTVSWGDGIKDSTLTHAYATTSETQIRIDGTFTDWGGVNPWEDANCLLSVDRWGATGTTDLNGAFRNADNLRHIESIPTTTVNLYGAFRGVDSNFTLGKLNTSKVAVMQSMFADAKEFNQPVNFDTSNATGMAFMFSGAEKFNHPVEFDTSKVEDMNNMFYGASAFNQPVKFNTPALSSMYGMFDNALSFNQPVSSFDTSKVSDFSDVFHNARAFNQPVNFDTSKATVMRAMFSSAAAFNQPLNFDTAKVVNMQGMFNFTVAFNQPLNFDTSKVTNMGLMFFGAQAFNQDLSGWKVPLVTARSGFDTSATAWTLPRPVWKK